MLSLPDSLRILSTVNAAQNQLPDALQFKNELNYRNYKAYDHPILKIHLLYPSDWKIVGKPTGLVTYLPVHNNLDCYPNAILTVIALHKLPLDQLASEQADDLKQRQFVIIDSKATTIHGNRAYSITSIANSEDHRKAFGYSCFGDKHIDRKITQIYVIIANKGFIFQYDASLQEYSRYWAVIETIIDSMKFEIKKANIGIQSGIIMNVPPSDIVINPVTNRLYVTADKVYVIDGKSNTVIANITTGGYLNNLAVNQITNTIYASSSQDGKVYVIDGYTNKVKSYFNSSHNIGEIGVDVNAGSIGSLIFVINNVKGTVSVIDGTTHVLIKEIPVGRSPSDIAIDSLTKRAYVANTENNTISVIDYVIYNNRTAKFEKIDDIRVGLFPTSIVANSNTNRVYVANSGIDSISVIGYVNRTAKFEKIDDIRVGLFPNSVAINPNNGSIYIGHADSNVLSVIDPSKDEVKTNIRNISIGNTAKAITVSPVNRLIYTAGFDPNTIYVINETSNKPLVVGTFNTNPPNAGIIYCNNQKITNFKIYSVDTSLQCIAQPNEGYAFSSWSGDLVPTYYSNSINVTSSKAYYPIIWFGNQIYYHFSGFFGFRSATSDLSAVNFTLSKYGSLNANFVQPIQVSIPPEFWTPFYALIPGLFIPSIISWLNGRRQRKHLSQYRNKIDNIYDEFKKSTPKNRDDLINSLDKTQIQVTQGLEKGKISESHYRMLKDRISEYVNQSNKTL
jgi:YVTN family beta-propeller protein